MKTLSLLFSILIICTIFAFTYIPSLTGKWSGELTTDDGRKFPLTYNLKLIGDSICGTANSSLGEFAIENGRYDTTGLRFIVRVNGLDIIHHGVLFADSLGMNIYANGSTIHCTLFKNAN